MRSFSLIGLSLAAVLAVAAGAAAPEAFTHDSDADGALIGAATGAAALSLILVTRCPGGPCSLGIVGGTLIGGLAGLVVGGLLDAADPLTSPEERLAPPPAEAVRPDSAAVTIRGREPVSRRNDFIGAVIGAVAADLLTATACSSISDTGGCPLFHPAYLPAIAIGALLGAGIGSAIGESSDENRE